MSDVIIVRAPNVIRVTADHIAKGVATWGDACPIALALKEQWPASSVDVGSYRPGYARVWDQGWWRAELPADAYDFIQDFDEGSPVLPFEFAVEWVYEGGLDT